MARRALVLVTGTLAGALTLLVFVGLRVAERDRERLYASYAHEREQAIAETARGIGGEMSDIGEDLDLASTLVQGASSGQLAERELHAIATIKREYMAVHARGDDGTTTNVIAYNAPPGLDGIAQVAVDQQLASATHDPGVLHVSRSFTTSGEPAWFRVFARRPKDHGPVVAVVVDMTVLLGRLKIQRDPLSRNVILDAAGNPAATSDPTLARVLDAEPALHSLVTGLENRTNVIGPSIAQKIGLPASSAVAVSVPFTVDPGPPWRLVVVASAQSLQVQERTIARRVLVGSALVLVLLLSAAGYVLYNAFRARSLRERLAHAEHLAHLTEKAEKILDHIPSGVLALAADLRIVAANRGLAEKIGRDIVGKRLDDAFAGGQPDDIKVVSELVECALATGEVQYLHRERISLLGGDAALNIHAVPLARGVGDVSVLLVFDDLTQLRRIEDRLLHSEKLVTAGQLAAGIAHEVGTPLNVARGRVELALSHLGPGHQEAENHRIVIDQIDRVTRLIQQLLDYVRPAPASVRSVDLAQALQDVSALLAPQAAKRHVSLRVETPPSGPTLRADPDQVQQIVLNLTLNAIDACDSGGAVTLRAARNGEGVALEVVDDGHGIPVELQKQVFDPFFTTKKRGQGTGLGLWVVAQLVRAQAAEIRLDSTPGQGTTAHVIWPVTT